MNPTCLFSAAWDTPTDSPAQKLVLLFLADKAGSKGTCWPSVATIAEKTGLSRKTVFTQIKKLQEKGLIRIHSGHLGVEGASNVSNRYALKIKPTPPGETITPPSVTVTPPLVKPLHPNPNSRTQIEPKGGSDAPFLTKGAAKLPYKSSLLKTVDTAGSQMDRLFAAYALEHSLDGTQWRSEPKHQEWLSWKKRKREALDLLQSGCYLD